MAEEAAAEEEEAAAAPAEIKVQTSPHDARFPATNQSRHCYTRYNEYYRCVAQKGEEDEECKFVSFFFFFSFLEGREREREKERKKKRRIRKTSNSHR